MQAFLSQAFQIGRRPRNRTASSCGQKHGHMRFAAIDPHGEKREGVAVQGMGRIRNRYFTRQLFKEWGISLCLILRADFPSQRRPCWKSAGSNRAHSEP
jgi:hypothetical protein